MRTPTHHLFGATLALTAVHWHPPVTGTVATAVYVAAATATAGGWLSPDVDNQPAWKTIDRFLPDELLGNGGPMQHRGLAHWWGIAAALAVAVHLGQVPPAAVPVALGAVTGWGSHILGDLVFGKANPRYGLKKGVPLLPWGWHIGLGLKADGWVEHLANALLLPAVGWLTLTIGGVL